MKKSIMTLFLALMMSLGLAAGAWALQEVGPIDAVTGFPAWFEDNAGLRLQLCDEFVPVSNDPADPGNIEQAPCLPELIEPEDGVVADNIGEALYYGVDGEVAVATGDLAGVFIRAQCALEAAGPELGVGDPSVANVALLRIRNLALNNAPTGDYVVTTPCAVFAFNHPVDTENGDDFRPEEVVAAGAPTDIPPYSGALGSVNPAAPIQFFVGNGTGANVLLPGVFLGDGGGPLEGSVGPLDGPLREGGQTTVTVTIDGDLVPEATITDFAVVGKLSGCTEDNEAPIAVNDFVATTAGTAVAIDVLANDSDVVVSDPTAIPPTTEVISPPLGTLTIVPDSLDPIDSGTLSITGNSITFTPAEDFTGTATFEYTVTDPCGLESNIATVAILVEDLQFNQADLRVRTGKWAINGTSSIRDLNVEVSPTETAYVTGLFGAQEVSPVTSAAAGDFTVIFDSTDPTAFNYDLTVTVPEGTNFTQAHIHVGNTGNNGPVIFFLCTNLENAPVGTVVPACAPVDGVISVSGILTENELVPRPDQGINNFAEAVTAIQTGSTYVNVHSEAVTSGEVRGQIGRNVISLHVGTDGPAIGAAEVQEDLSWGINGKLNVSPETSSTIEAKSGLGNTETRQLRLR